MKILYIGDPHIKPDNVLQSNEVMKRAMGIAIDYKVDRIVILGDLFHNHAIVRVEVLEFWNKWLKNFSEKFEVVVLCGNHDMVGDYKSKSHALSVFRGTNTNIVIVDVPTVMGLHGYLPYFHNKEEFILAAKDLVRKGAKVLICHQTIMGSEYENGFFAPDGIDPKLIPFDFIISGHIHKRQYIKSENKEIFYPGTWRSDSASDMNEYKSLSLIVHSDINGLMVKESPIDTYDICPPIIGLSWKQGEEMPKFPIEDSRVTIELIGTSDWVKEQKPQFIGKASVRAKITDSKTSVSRKSGDNIVHFIENIFVTSADRSKMIEFMKEEGLV